MEQWIAKADVLLEALPYIQSCHDKVLVIKFGGSSMKEPERVQKILQDIVFMRFVGMKPLIVHGGGPAINATMKQKGLKPLFFEGLRVTDKETMDIVANVLINQINADLVQTLSSLGAKAQGLFSKEDPFIQTKKIQFPQKGTSMPDIGYVGEVDKVNSSKINKIMEQGFIPVVPPIGLGSDGQPYNINGDTVAGELAVALKAQKLVYLTDVQGVLKKRDDPSSLVKTMNHLDVKSYIDKGIIQGGMIPKIRSCLKAIQNGTQKGHMIDSRIEHSLLLEIFTDEGIGTELIL
ncbi:acetylglutamate kinase [PVC group bacterium (ex Bugula neritina AB1)]|nr:acetylglutamate kinase [PVC group bacterium (ex Bugula neritina AB1)]